MAAVSASGGSLRGNLIYLPRFKVILRNTPNKPPTQASFLVPLWFSKLDLRDYLQSAYNVRIHGVRSYVKQSRVQQGRNSDIRAKPKRWHRPRATKFMTVELDRPFVWPELPEPEEGEEDPFETANYQANQKASRKYNEKYSNPLGADRYIDEDRYKRMREQAQALLDGKEKWTPPKRFF